MEDRGQPGSQEEDKLGKDGEDVATGMDIVYWKHSLEEVAYYKKEDKDLDHNAVEGRMVSYATMSLS